MRTPLIATLLMVALTTGRPAAAASRPGATCAAAGEVRRDVARQRALKRRLQRPLTPGSNRGANAACDRTV